MRLRSVSRESGSGNQLSMAGMAGVVVAMTGIAGLAILPTMLLPGAGLIGATVVIVLGGGSVAWLLLEVANGRAPTRPRRLR
jgi:hypothetical protein